MPIRNDVKQLVIPEHLQDVLSRIAEAEERSMSASVRVMITRRARELGLQVERETEELELQAA